MLTPAQKLARRLAHEAASENARRLGLSRRAFLVSAAGAASTLAACNRANAGARGGSFAIDDEAALDQQRAAAAVGGDEFIFDVQTHCVEPTGRWAQGADGERWARDARAQVFGQARKCTGGSFDCYSAQTLAREVFLDSDTDVAVVSALWGQPNPTPIEYADEAREIVASIGGEGARALIHGGVFPQEPGAIEAMDAMAERHRVEAWKLYPQYGANGRGIFLDRSDDANRFFERARALGVKIVAVHKGVPLPGLEYEYSSPRDMGPAAVANPDLTFLVYHGGFEGGKTEGPYNPDNPQGRRPADQVAPGCGPPAQPGQSLRRDRLALALFHEPAGRGRARDRQIAQIFRRGADHVGDGFDLVRLARRTRSRPSAPSDQRGISGALRLSGADRRGEAQDFRPQRRPRLRYRRRRPARPRRAARAPRRLSRATPIRASPPTARRPGANSSRCGMRAAAYRAKGAQSPSGGLEQ